MSKTLEQMIRMARRYFSLNSTREILLELRPMMCPWDMSFVRAVCCLSLFLPTDLPPEHHHLGYKLWIDELVYWWLHVQNCPPWEGKLVQLLSRLTYDNIGYVDWNERMPDMFTKLLRYERYSCPILYESPHSKTFVQKFWFDGFLSRIRIYRNWFQRKVGWSRCCIHLAGQHDGWYQQCTTVHQPVVQSSRILCTSVQPWKVIFVWIWIWIQFWILFFIRWQNNILNFLQRLALAVCQRVHRERYKQPDWRNKIPDNWKLTDSVRNLWSNLQYFFIYLNII